jgi:hypothetical protein
MLYCIATVAPPATAQTLRTEPLSELVKTLSVSLADNKQADPYINLNSDDAVEINFDVLGAEPETLTYTLTHCNADNSPSNLLDSEFMDGFQNRIADDYAISLNTTMQYVNYRILIPNENVAPKISGNYALHVFPENSDEPILCAMFYVVEPNVDIDLRVSSQTDRGVNNNFQQVSFTLRCPEQVKTPLNDLKVHVVQNERHDNKATGIKPRSVQNRLLTYEHIPELIFNAGNEYRRFEMTTRKFNGLHIQTISFHDPFFHVALFPDRARSDAGYEYYEDINGQIYIRTLDGDSPDYEADYYIVHFFLPAEKPLENSVYILSRAFNNLLDNSSLMEYSEQSGGYAKTAVLKEGYYNYVYVQWDGKSAAATAQTEGDYFQTENDYRVLVYFRRAGDRADRLIGNQTLKFK